MKILKPGKVEQRKFVCPDCEWLCLDVDAEETDLLPVYDWENREAV